MSYILDENVEKGISSLTISDCDQETKQDQCPTCPSEFSDFPPLSADNTRGQINKEEEKSREIQEEIVIEITNCQQDQEKIQICLPIWFVRLSSAYNKVEKVLKGSLDTIPSPSL